MSIKKTVIYLLFSLVTLFITRSAFAFGGDDHQDICERGLRPIKRLIDDNPISFVDRAISIVCREDVDTDSWANFQISSIHFDAENLREGSGRLKQLKTEVINEIKSDMADGDKARKTLGGSLHTLQDFFAHSNWMETRVAVDLGDSILDNPDPGKAFCTNDGQTLIPGINQLTSGYWPGGLEDACGPIPAGKCRHGYDYIGWSCGGIAKDSPSSAFYDAARGVAISHTTKYVDKKIIDAVMDNPKAVRTLMLVKGTLGMVIDTTGSMGDDIDTVKAKVTSIINKVRGTEDEPVEYLLEPFGDPSWGPPSKFTDPDKYLSAVNALYAEGGGDCPEYSQSALLQAISESRSDSNLYLFTDASAKDRNKARSVTAAANKKRIKISAFLTGSCFFEAPEVRSVQDDQSTVRRVRADGIRTADLSSDIDPAYINNAESTGGQLFLLDESQLDQAFEDLVAPQLSGDFVTITRVKDTLAGELKRITIPVDSTITRLVLSTIIDTANTVTLTRPSGAKVTPGDPQVKFTTISSGIIITIEEPESGNWQISIAGSGNFIMAAQANSSLDLFTFEFVKEHTERHVFYEPIPGQPVTGKITLGRANLVGPFQTAIFRLVDEAGNTLQSINLAKKSSMVFIGPLTLPNVPFRIAVSGLDANGKAYERLFPSLFQAQSVEVVIDPATNFLRLPRNATTTFRFNVHNLGQAGAFQITVADNLGFAQTPNPNLLTLGTGETQSFTVDVVVPAGVPDGSTLLLTAIATSTANPDLTNSAVATAVITETTYTVTVGKDGTGTGTVVSNPVGLDCGATCTASFASETAVILTATPAANSIFAGWSPTTCGGFTLTANATCTATFNLANQLPVANAGLDQTSECAGPNRASVILDGSGSSDPDGNPLTFTWTGPFGTASGRNPTIALPLGTHTLTLTVDDGNGGTATDTVVVAVRDTTPPNIQRLTATPDTLSPSNHKMVSVKVAAAATDLCSTIITCKITSVSSNEPVNGTGDGDTAPDWKITGNLTATLRAERAGNGSGRVYTLPVQCMDRSANSTSKSVTVTVPQPVVIEGEGKGGGGSIGMLDLLLATLGLALLRRRHGATLLLLLVMVTLPVAAETTSRWYLGAGLGWTDTDASAGDLERRLADRGYTAQIELDNKHFGWKLLGGYRGGDHWGIEAAMVRLGEVTTRITADTNTPQNLVTAVADVHPLSVFGLSLSPVAYLPLGDEFLLSATAGPFFWWADTEASLRTATASFTSDNDESGVGWTVGLGAGYSPTPALTLRLGWDYYKADRDGHNLLSAQVIYWFGS